MPSRHAILLPIFGLAAWTFMVLVLILIARVRAGRAGRVRVSDFRMGESPAVPEDVCIPNRNYMNLLELPLLFYVVCLVLFVTGSQGPIHVVLAWAYVALRVLHSLIHLSYNHVYHRLAAFACSNGVLIALWVLAGWGLLDA